MKLLLILHILLAQVCFAQGGDRTGNGGDYVRSAFISEANRLLMQLESSLSGQSFYQKYNLSAYSLREVLATSVIEVTDDRLFDQFGNEVDALGGPGRITLNNERWKKLFASGADLRIIIFHEVLRAIDMNDDDYIISKHLPLTDIPDPYLRLKKEFNFAKPSSAQYVVRKLSNPWNKNLIWECEFAEINEVENLKLQIWISVNLNSEFHFIDYLTKVKVAQNVSVVESLTGELSLPRFKRLEYIKTVFKLLSSNVLLLNFDERVFGKCAPF